MKEFFGKLFKNVFFWLLLVFLALVLFIAFFEYYANLGTNKFYNLF